MNAAIEIQRTGKTLAKERQRLFTKENFNLSFLLASSLSIFGARASLLARVKYLGNSDGM
jgi:hypothetical protein